MTLKCVIADDEPLAREGLAHYIQEIDFLDLKGVAENPLELSRILDKEKIDLIFLDIQMPLMSGIDFLKVRPGLPMVIITTAFPAYALEGFQFDAMDYLLKPITFTRFFKAVNKAREYHQLRQAGTRESPEQENFFFIKCDSKYEKIFIDKILFVQALQNYVFIHTESGRFMTLLPLKTVEEHLENAQFIKVHKSYVVSIRRIESIENHEIRIRENRIPVSRHYREQVMEKILRGSLLKK